MSYRSHTQSHFNFLFLLKAFLIFSSFLNYSLCFWDGGHQIIANIAAKKLSTYSLSLQFFEEITKVMKEMSHKKIGNFVESATWADITKEYQNTMLDEWHYKDVPYNESMTEMPYIDLKNDKSSSLALIFNANKTLLTWTSEEKSDISSQFEKSFYLRYIIHVIGDVHQPLHSCTLINKQYPDGDRGGNLIRVNYTPNKEINNLHKLWDSVLNTIFNEYSHPMSESQFDKLNKDTEAIMKEYPMETFNYTEFTSAPIQWVKESWGICKDNVYKGITNDITLDDSSDYIKNNKSVIRKRLAIGGYRLFVALYKFWISGKLGENEAGVGNESLLSKNLK